MHYWDICEVLGMVILAGSVAYDLFARMNNLPRIFNSSEIIIIGGFWFLTMPSRHRNSWESKKQ